MIDRELMQQALEAIQTFREYEMGQDYHSNRDAVLARAFAAEDALRSRLAQFDGGLGQPSTAQAQAKQPEQEPWTDADADAARLALELECLLLDTKDMAAVSRWWASANDALELHRQRLSRNQMANQAETSDSPCTGVNPVDVRADVRALQSPCTACGQPVPEDWSCPVCQQPEQEPVAWGVFASNGNVRLWSQDREAVRAFAERKGLPLAPLYADPQPQRKPLPDWIAYDADSDTLTILGKRYSAAMFGERGFLSPVGTVLRIEQGANEVVTVSEQPQRKPLSRQQLVALELSLRQYHDGDRYDLSLHDFARAIEQAHGIKGEDK